MNKVMSVLIKILGFEMNKSYQNGVNNRFELFKHVPKSTLLDRFGK